jgi:hypothetical protein
MNGRVSRVIPLLIKVAPRSMLRKIIKETKTAAKPHGCVIITSECFSLLKNFKTTRLTWMVMPNRMRDTMRTSCRKSVKTAKNWFCRISLKILKKIGSPRTPIPKNEESHTQKCRVF